MFSVFDSMTPVITIACLLCTHGIMAQVHEGHLTVLTSNNSSETMVSC